MEENRLPQDHLLTKQEELIIPVDLDCLNCGHPLRSNDFFCSNCGQKNIHKLSFLSFLNQLIAGFFSYDSRFWTTIIPLSIKPGKVSKDYIEGKRARYVNPFRLYLHVSIIFFLLVGLSNKLENKIEKEKLNSNNALQFNLSENNNSVNTFNFSDIDFKKDTTFVYASKANVIDSISFLNKINDFYNFSIRNNEVDPEQAIKELGYPITSLNKFSFEQMQKVEEMRKDNAVSFGKIVLSNISIALFIFLPLFTLFLKIFYFKKKMNYIEHLVFVFNIQTVFFILMIVYLLLNIIFSIQDGTIFIITFMIYLFIALKKFYNQGIFKTVFKFIFLNFVYIILSVFGIGVVTIIAFLIS